MSEAEDRIDSGMMPDERGIPYSIAEAERIAIEPTVDIYIRQLVKFLLRRIERLAEKQMETK